MATGHLPSVIAHDFKRASLSIALILGVLGHQGQMRAEEHKSLPHDVEEKPLVLGKDFFYIIGPGLPLQTVSETTEVVEGAVFTVVRCKKTKHEHFRIRIGEPGVTWWNYGITGEGDLNGDGKTDYGWYGGDDTSIVRYAFISTRKGFRKVDVDETFRRAWKRDHASEEALRDIQLVGEGDWIEQVRMVRSTKGLILEGIVVRDRDDDQKRPMLSVAQQDFVYTTRLD